MEVDVINRQKNANQKTNQSPKSQPLENAVKVLKCPLIA